MDHSLVWVVGKHNRFLRSKRCYQLLPCCVLPLLVSVWYPQALSHTLTRKGQRLMQLPIVAPAPLVTAHADVFRDLFENRCQFQHFQNYLTGLIVQNEPVPLLL